MRSRATTGPSTGAAHDRPDLVRRDGQVGDIALGRGAAGLGGDAVLVRIFSQSSPTPLAAPSAYEAADRVADAAGDPAPESGDDSGARTEGAAEPDAGQLSPPRLGLALGAGALVFALLAFALHRTWTPALMTGESASELVPSSPLLDLEAATDGLGSGLRHHLGAIDSWARTLDDRWPTLTEADKRIAVQIILRNTTAAIDELREPLLTG